MNIIHTNYFSPKEYKIQFGHEDGRPCSVKFDKGNLLKGLMEQREQLGVKFMFGYLAYGGSDDGEKIQVQVKCKDKHDVIIGLLCESLSHRRAIISSIETK